MASEKVSSEKSENQQATASQQVIEINNNKLKNSSISQDQISKEGSKNLESNQENQNQKKCDLKAWIPKIIILMIILGILAFSIIKQDLVSDWLTDFIEWIEENPVIGTIIFVFVYIFGTVAFFPGSILTIGAGFVFFQVFKNVGWALLVGSIAVWIGAELGSILAMLLGRYVFRESVAQKAQKWKYFGAIDKAVVSDGFKIVFMLRISPIIPFNLFNYMMGLTAVKVREYALGGLGMLPGTILFVYIGTTLGNVADLAAGNYDGGIAYIIFLVIGIVVGFAALIYIGVLTKKELKKYLDIDEKEKKQQQEKEKQENNSNQEFNNNQKTQEQQNIQIDLNQKENDVQNIE